MKVGRSGNGGVDEHGDGDGAMIGIITFFRYMRIWFGAIYAKSSFLILSVGASVWWGRGYREPPSDRWFLPFQTFLSRI